MTIVYHLVAGIITLFAVTQVEDGKQFIELMRKSCKNNQRSSESRVEQIVQWGFYLVFASATWLVLWPLILISWTLSKLVQRENPTSEEK